MIGDRSFELVVYAIPGLPLHDWSAAAPTFHAWNGRQELTSQQQQPAASSVRRRRPYRPTIPTPPCSRSGETQATKPGRPRGAAVRVSGDTAGIQSPVASPASARAAPRHGVAPALHAHGSGWPRPARARLRVLRDCVSVSRGTREVGAVLVSRGRPAGSGCPVRVWPAAATAERRRPLGAGALPTSRVHRRIPVRSCRRLEARVGWRGACRARRVGSGRGGVALVYGWCQDGIGTEWKGKLPIPSLASLVAALAGWLGFLPPPQAALEITHKLSHPCAEHAWRGVEWNPTEASCISLVLVRCLLLLLLGHTHTLPGFAFLTLMLSGPN
jgi:hypothetical protein